MYFKIKVSNSAEKFISKLDGTFKKKVVKFIESLENNPVPRNKKHILDMTGNSFLCEYVIDELRFYYTIENQFVVIEEIEYCGKVEILKGYSNHKSGNSQNFPNQRKDIKNLKRDFVNKFKK